MGDPNPQNHRCDLPDINYKLIDDGQIFCKRCGRIWDKTEWGWKPDPQPPMSKEKLAAVRKAQYGKRAAK